MNANKNRKKRITIEALMTDIYCPKEHKRVPIWYCLGSPSREINMCPELIKANVDFGKNRVKINCKLLRDWEHAKIGDIAKELGHDESKNRIVFI